MFGKIGSFFGKLFSSAGTKALLAKAALVAVATEQFLLQHGDDLVQLGGLSTDGRRQLITKWVTDFVKSKYPAEAWLIDLIVPKIVEIIRQQIAKRSGGGGIVAPIAMIFALAMSASVARAGVFSLPFANDGALHTRLVVENVGGTDIQFGFSTFRAHSATYFQSWGVGVDARDFVLPDSLEAYVEITAPDGRSFIVETMPALDASAIYETVGLDGGTLTSESFLVAFSPQVPSGLLVRCYADGQFVPDRSVSTAASPGHAALVKCNSIDSRVTLSATAGSVHALTIRRDLATGEWLVLPLRKAQ